MSVECSHTGLVTTRTHSSKDVPINLQAVVCLGGKLQRRTHTHIHIQRERQTDREREREDTERERERKRERDGRMRSNLQCWKYH
jgi:hypothetical protein